MASSSPAWAQAPSDPGASADLGAVKAQFSNAQKLFKAGKFADALPLFREVAETTHSPNAQLYVGHCLQQLGKYVEAYKAFAGAVKEITEHPEEKYEQTREAAVSQLAVLNVRVGKVVVALTDIPPDTSVTLDGTPVDEKELGSSIVVAPGSHHVEAAASGMATLRRDLSVDGGEVKTLTLSFRRVDDPRPAPVPAPPPAQVDHRSDGGSSMRTAGYVTAGVGVAGLLTFSIAALMAKSTYDSLQSDCANRCSDPGHLGDVDRGKALQTTANVGLVVGLLCVAGGTTLIVLGSGKNHDAQVSVSPAGGTIAYTGRF